MSVMVGCGLGTTPPMSILYIYIYSALLNNCVAFGHMLGFELAQLLVHEHQIAQSNANYCEARKYKTGELRWEI